VTCISCLRKPTLERIIIVLINIWFDKLEQVFDLI
jgi:hypothetical protein